jgi:hypothetical protein
LDLVTLVTPFTYVPSVMCAENDLSATLPPGMK